MRVLVTGAAGMIGRKLTARLLSERKLGDRSITELDLQDVVPFDAPDGNDIKIATQVSDLAAPGSATALAARRPDVVFHLAGIVSGQAEAEFELGYHVKLDGT